MAIDLCVDGFDDEDGGDAPSGSWTCMTLPPECHKTLSLLNLAQDMTTLLTTLPLTHCHELLQGTHKGERQRYSQGPNTKIDYMVLHVL